MAGAPHAEAVVVRLVDEMEAELDAMVAAIGRRIRADVPAFRRLPERALAGAVRGNVERALAALREVREPSADELERAAEIGRERAEQGLTLDAVLHAYRITVGAVWARFGEVAREHGADVPSVIACSETLWRWADAVMDVVAAGHREVELEQAREEQQRRDGFVLALLTGGADARALVEESPTFGLDPERDYLCFRARASRPGAARELTRRTARALAGPEGLTTALDRDLVGLTPQAPAAVEGVTVGLGRLGAELERTLRTWFDSGMRTEETARLLHVHPNTLRHRMRRFEAATGADLHRAADLVELWWALERRRLRRRPEDG